MNPSRASLLLAAVPAVAASFAVLAWAEVGRGVWAVHLLLVGAACLLALAGHLTGRRAGVPAAAHAVTILTLVGVGVPILGGSAGPERWVQLGPFSLYAAPLLLPSLLVACSVYLRAKDGTQAAAFVAPVAAGLLLALQPDASQVLALLAGSAVLFLCYRPGNPLEPALALAFVALVTAWAFTRPDPLEPVPHVEGVFALAFERSLWAGLAVVACAAALVGGLVARAARGPFWLAAVAAYYAVLFACSVAGLTPAPLIGYGAGPLLGFGLLVAAWGWLEPDRRPDR